MVFFQQFRWNWHSPHGLHCKECHVCTSDVIFTLHFTMLQTFNRFNQSPAINSPLLELSSFLPFSGPFSPSTLHKPSRCKRSLSLLFSDFHPHSVLPNKNIYTLFVFYPIVLYLAWCSNGQTTSTKDELYLSLNMCVEGKVVSGTYEAPRDEEVWVSGGVAPLFFDFGSR
jgi:hypothetical protein